MFTASNTQLFLEIQPTLLHLIRTRAITADLVLYVELLEYCKNQFIRKVEQGKEVTPGFLKTWVKQRCFDYLRTNRGTRVSIDDAAPMRIVSSQADFTSFDEATDEPCVDLLFTGVSAKHRALYEDVHELNLSYAQVAIKYGVSINSIGKTLNRVKVQLRSNAATHYPHRMAS
jgi:DNA-directed RNA polymerase specialized sigma24 family protein